MKQPFILTLVSSVACAATAANKAPENTTPTKSKTPNVVFIYADDLATAIWNVTELKTYRHPTSTDWQNRESFSPMLTQQPPPAPLPATPC